MKASCLHVECDITGFKIFLKTARLIAATTVAKTLTQSVADKSDLATAEGS